MAAGLLRTAPIGAMRPSHRLIAIVIRLHTEKPLDAADDAANRSANDGTHRAGNPPAFAGTVRDAARNALSLSCERRCEARRDDAYK